MSNPAKVLRAPRLEANYKMTKNGQTVSRGSEARRLSGRRPAMVAIASLVLLYAAGVWLGEPAGEQTQSQQNGAAKPARPTDLARENLGLVAASATEISTVLQQDPGLMVDLKEWIARDATNQG